MDERLKQLLTVGRELYEKRDFDKAEPYLREVGAKLPGFADVQNMLGVILHHDGKYEESRAAFEKALEINPKYTEAALNLAVTYNELGKYAEAKAVYERVVNASRSGPRRLDPFARGKIANMHAELARAYEDVGLLEQAIAQYHEALGLCPEFADIRTRLGHVMRDSGDVDGAVAQYREAKESNPKYVPARVHLGVSLFALGHSDEAIEEWESALDHEPENRVAVTYLRMVRQLQAQEEAEADGVKIDVRHEDGTVAAIAQEEAERRTFYRPEPEEQDDATDEVAVGLKAPDTEVDEPEPVTATSDDSGNNPSRDS